MKIMRPGFGEILPGMSGGIDADKFILPARRRAFAVMPGERRVIVDALIAEAGTEAGLLFLIAADQPVPEIMSAFMPEMTEQGAIGLAHFAAGFLAHRVIGFLQGKRDQAIVVTGHHCLGMGLGRIGEKIE